MIKTDIQSEEIAADLVKMIGELKEGREKLKNESVDTLNEALIKLRSQDNLPSDNPDYIDFHTFVNSGMCMIISSVIREKNKNVL